MSHTPGPWVATETKYRTLIYAEDGDRIGECQSLSAGDLDLILAAPDLLEALKNVIRGVPDTWDGVIKARAAIKKAEGV
jgi:hypothetical protein